MGRPPPRSLGHGGVIQKFKLRILLGARLAAGCNARETSVREKKWKGREKKGRPRSADGCWRSEKKGKRGDGDRVAAGSIGETRRKRAALLLVAEGTKGEKGPVGAP